MPKSSNPVLLGQAVLHYNEEECTGHLDHILRLKKLDLWKFSRSVTRVPCYAIAAASEGANIP